MKKQRKLDAGSLWNQELLLSLLYYQIEIRLKCRLYCIYSKCFVFFVPCFTVYPWDYSRHTSSFQWICRPWTGNSECSEWWVIHPPTDLELCLLASVLVLNKMSSKFLKGNGSVLFSPYWFCHSSRYSFHLQTPCSAAPDKINRANLEAESFPPLLPPYHLETTHLGSVLDLGPLPQVICLIVASKPTSRPLPNSSNIGFRWA